MDTKIFPSIRAVVAQRACPKNNLSLLTTPSPPSKYFIFSPSQGLTLCVIQSLLACILPAVDYYYVYRHDNGLLGPQAWMIWAVISFLGLIGFLAHGVGSSILTLVHLVTGSLFSAAVAAYSTAWWFVLQLQCSISQQSYQGCDTVACPCAATDSCSASDFAANGACAACKAPRAEVCDPVHQTYTMYTLAFTGLAVLIFSLPVLCIDVHILMVGAARRAAKTARIAAIRVGVEQQNRLISAGDKPTVTPGTLTDWVAILLAHGDAATKFVAEKCRAALRSRGYELPVKGGGKKLAFKNEANIIQYIPLGSSIASLDEDPSEIIVTTTANGGGGGIGGGSNKKIKRKQVTPEESQITQEASTSSYMIV